MLHSLAHIILTGFLVRADGWGAPDDSRWKRVSDFFNVFSCSAIFAVLSLLILPPLTALCAGLAFLIWRMPGFNGWHIWLNMFWRGLWTSALGFTLLSYVVHNHFYYGLLAIPFSAIYMLIYSGAYNNWVPETFLGFNKHVWVEHSSGWAFRIAIFIITVWSI